MKLSARRRARHWLLQQLDRIEHQRTATPAPAAQR